MSVVWSVMAALVTAFISREFRTSVFIGLLVFSHWVVDFIVKPMLAAFPTDSGLPLLFDGSPTVGLGLYKTQIGVTISEYGTLILGIVIYVMYIDKKRRTDKEKKLNLIDENKNF